MKGETEVIPEGRATAKAEPVPPQDDVIQGRKLLKSGAGA